MSSDGYFDGDDDFDASALQQLDAIEAAHFSPKKTAPTRDRSTSPIPPAQIRPHLSTDSSFNDISFDVDETELAKLDTFIQDSYAGKAQPVAGPSKLSRTSSNNTRQLTLYGEVLPPTTQSNSNKAPPKPQMERSKSAQRLPFGQQAPKTKTWDQTAFAKSGTRKSKQKGKGKGKAGAGNDSEEENLEFEQFPAPFVPIGPPPPMKINPDLLEARHWIYPLNRPKRDYQYNIVRNSLFENTLVALPTGLGKTFIAGVLMLNYYRWFPEGKIVFVAPTKPLVSQQIIACHETCGIPGSDSIELNGEVPTATRARYWNEKRVFFMTPQTLINDLQKQTCNVGEIVCLVIDEAHRASGDYAYNQIVRFMMAKNPHFRVLALTATPGNNAEAVQSLVDGLHISRIEIRNEESLDLKAYIHKKTIVTHIIKPNPDLLKIRDLLVKAMDPHMNTLRKAGLIYPSESAISIHPFRPQALMAENKNPALYTPLAILGKLARVMMYLMTGSFETSYQFLDEMRKEVHEDEPGAKKQNNSSRRFRDDPKFQALMREVEAQRNAGWGVHPKVDKLKNILIQHFGVRLAEEPGEGATGNGEPDDTKCMVFSSYRGVVQEIVRELDKERPLIRAVEFIGQGTDKQGNKGLQQKEQLDVIKKFKAGEYNVLVATCIGEEGLDIGEIDLTVCYDADKAPTRMIQRFGRTGRKRAGTIHTLLAEGREDNNIEKAEANYKEVQKVITKGSLYELYSDVERLIPPHIKPECIEKVVEIQHYVKEDTTRKRGSPKKGTSTKRKRNDDVGRNIPDGASTGFVSVRDLVIKGAKKPKKMALPKDFDACGQDDETDEDLESGRVIAPPRRTQSAAAGPSSPAKRAPKTKIKKASTIGGTKAPKSRKKKEPEPEPEPELEETTLSQFSKQGEDDSDDMAIEQGVIMPSHISKGKALSKIVEEEISPPRRTSPRKRINRSIIELTDSEESDGRAPSSPIRRQSPIHNRSPTPDMDDPFNHDQDMSWLVDHDEDDHNFEIIDSSPLVSKTRPPLERMEIDDESIEISHPVRNMYVDTSDPLEALDDDSVQFVQFVQPSSNIVRQNSWHSGSQRKPRVVSPPLFSPSKKTNVRIAPRSKVLLSPSGSSTDDAKGKAMMPPPAIPQRFLESPQMPEASFPVRPMGHQAKRRRVVLDEPESPLDLPPASQRRLHRVESTPIRTNPKAKTQKKEKTHRPKPTILGRNANALFDGEAAHSGDDVSEGESNSEDDEESESDRMFLKDSPMTQGTQSYDQTQIYRRSLMTQAPGNEDGPAFARGPSRGKPFGRIDGPRRRVLPSSSPPPPDEELDNYDLDSFVVGDDEDIVYEDSF